MRKSSMTVFGVLVLALTFNFVAGSEDPTASFPGVVDLTPSNFDAIVNGKKAVFAEFYAPWCGHCKHLAPVWKQLGEKIAADAKLSSRVVIAKVDADAHNELGQRFGVQGFPTLKWFPRGKPTAPEDYQGGRDFAQLLSYIEDAIKADAGFARVDALTPLARKFDLATDGAEKTKLAGEIEAEAGKVGEVDKANAELYVKYAKKALEKGSEYIAGELARLEKILDAGSLSATKVEEISKKVSVLSAFKEDEPVAAEPAETLQSGSGGDDEYADVE